MLDFAGRAKWDAWDRLGKGDEFARLGREDEVKERARRAYVDEARKLGFSEGEGEAEALTEPREGGKKERMVAVSVLEDSFVDEASVSSL